MYIISNKQMEDIISYIEAWKDGVQVEEKDTRTYNKVRLAKYPCEETESETAAFKA